MKTCQNDNVMTAHTRQALEAIADGTFTRAMAAVELECSERHVNRLMAEAGVHRPPGLTRQVRKDAKLAAATRREVRHYHAVLVDVGALDVATAALRAACSERTIYRYRKSK
jgi:hypothetical protein